MKTTLAGLLTLVLLSAHSLAGAAETPTKGYRDVFKTRAGVFVTCREFGHMPKCTNEAELPFEGGMVHQVIRLPKGAIIRTFPFGQIDGGLVNGIMELDGQVFVISQHAIHRYDVATRTLVKMFANRSHRIDAPDKKAPGPYLRLYDGGGRSDFHGLLLYVPGVGTWKKFQYEGPYRESVDTISEVGGRLKLTHYTSDAVTFFDPATGNFSQ